MKAIVDRGHIFKVTRGFFYDSVEEYLKTTEKFSGKNLVIEAIADLKIEDMKCTNGNKTEFGGRMPVHVPCSSFPPRVSTISLPQPDKKISYNRIDFILSDEKNKMLAYAISDVTNNWADAVYCEKGDTVDIYGVEPTPADSFKIFYLINHTFRKRKNLTDRKMIDELEKDFTIANISAL